MNFNQVKDILEAGSYIATVIGIPVAILVFLYEKRKDRVAQELETYLYANEKYIQYLSLCIEHPDLDCFDLSLKEAQVAATGQDIRKLSLFTILISMLETGYLLYRRHKSAVKRSQWQGWHDYMSMWASRPDFRIAWPALGSQFDVDFVNYINTLIRDTTEPMQEQEIAQPGVVDDLSRLQEPYSANS